jgi:hypothetical protein
MVYKYFSFNVSDSGLSILPRPDLSTGKDRLVLYDRKQ